MSVNPSPANLEPTLPDAASEELLAATGPNPRKWHPWVEAALETPLVQKMRAHPLWRLESGLVAGALAAGLLSGLLNHWNNAAAEDRLHALFKTVEVVTLNKDAKVGDVIDGKAVRRVEMLARNVTPNTVTAERLSMVVGKRMAIDTKAGDPILLTAIQGANEISGMAARIPAGKRLFTLTIADSAASRGFIKPNDHVDILAHVSLPNRGLTTFTVMQDVTLVSVGASSVMNEAGQSAGSDVSFFVDSKEIELLAFAQKRGEFSLSLRNPTDVGKRDTGAGVDLNGFLDADAIAKASGGGELAITSKGQKVGPDGH